MLEALIPTMAYHICQGSNRHKNHLFFELGNSSVLALVDNLHQCNSCKVDGKPSLHFHKASFTITTSKEKMFMIFSTINT